jgi:transcriptional regulator with XRE-family HTH domain
VTVHAAVKALRDHAGKTQQIFATELGISISSLSNYERTRMPEPAPLLKFRRVAEQVGRKDLEEVFNHALSESLLLHQQQRVFTTNDEFETRAVAVLLYLLRNHDILKGWRARAIVEQIAHEVSGPKENYEFEVEAVRRGYMVSPRTLPYKEEEER